MHLLAQLSLKNRALIALVTIVASVFGFIGVGSLKQELMPSVQFPAIFVVAQYPGASPEVVNNDVSAPIEAALRGVPGLETTTATASTGSAMVLAQFEYGIDLASTEQKVERAVARVANLMPSSVDTQVGSGSLDDLPIIQLAVLTGANGDTEATAALAERTVVPELEELNGVREAQLAGSLGERVTIAPDVDRLAAESLTTQSITDALQQSGVLVAAGSITENGQTLAVQAGSKLTSVEDLQTLPLVRSPELLQAKAQAEAAAAEAAAAIAAVPGTAGLPSTAVAPTSAAGPLPVITLGEVATVSLQPNPQQSISRVNGEPALTIAVTKLSSANTVEVSHQVTDALPSLEAMLDGATLEVIFDQAPYVESSIETLAVEGVLGLIFAILVILIFLMSVRATLVTAISIPVSVLLTFVGLNFAEYTLNLLTLGALTISIGRVVDDSIVVIENIKRHFEEHPGGDRSATIVTAVREVSGAITASTVTTVAVFLPMAFVAGMVGELFRPFAFTVTIALAASLLVSLTIVPVLAYWFLRDGKRARKNTDAAAGESETRVQRWYRPVIHFTLRKPLVTLLTAVVVFAGTVAMYPLMKTNFLGADEQNSVSMTQTLRPGTSLDTQLEQVTQVEAALAELDVLETVQVTIGNAGGMSALLGGGSDGTVSYSLTTDPDADQAEVQQQIRDAVAELPDAGEVSISAAAGGMGMSSGIEIAVTGPDQEVIAEASDAVVAALREQSGLVQVESNLAVSRPFLEIVVDRGAAANAGLTEAAVAGIVSQQMQPSAVGQIVLDTTAITMYLSMGEAPADQAQVAAIEIPTASGPVRLDSLARVAVADGPVTVTTENGNRIVTVSAQAAGDDLTAAGAAVTAALDSVDLPAGTSASIGGVMSQQEEAFGQLGIALLAAILIVYVVMVATFKSLLQPLLLLISVPFAATGAIILLVLSGIPLGVPSLIGVLMLIGIVVTNAIVLIDLVNQLRERGATLGEAVEQGSLLRVRPIIMTSLATILALTPMALGITGHGGFISQPLAVVVIGGLLSSTLLTLVVLPTLYFVVERARERGRDRRSARRGQSAPRHAAPVAAAIVAAPAVTATNLGADADADADAGADTDGSDGDAVIVSDPLTEPVATSSPSATDQLTPDLARPIQPAETTVPTTHEAPQLSAKPKPADTDHTEQETGN